MRIAILDPVAGISGDMTLGALVDAGLDPGWLTALPERLGIADVRVGVRRVERASLMATLVTFEIGTSPRRTAAGSDAGPPHGTHVGELIARVREAPLSDWVQRRSVRAFELLGEAEGKVHGVPPDAVHLHEVGAVDALLDVVGVCEGFERLGVDHIYHLPVAVGDGWVTAAHGELPVPAPATLLLLEGIDVRRGGPVRGEATTPTGAAIIRALSDGVPPERWRPLTVHWGAGSRDPQEYPNALRLIVAETADEAGQVEMIVTDMDDFSPEYLEPLRGALLAAGALDCQVWPTQGKKGRVSFRLEALAPPSAVDGVVAALFQHSTTGGVRHWSATRSTLVRHELAVELAEAVRVRVKVWQGAFGTRLKSEYDDVVVAAGRLGRSAPDVAREAEQRARAMTADNHERC